MLDISTNFTKDKPWS